MPPSLNKPSKKIELVNKIEASLPRFSYIMVLGNVGPTFLVRPFPKVMDGINL
jgi:hypothetical protein